VAARFRVESAQGVTRVLNLDTGQYLTDVVEVRFVHSLLGGAELLVTQRAYGSVVSVEVGSDADEDPDASRG
jgi:hypothetical protein